jgi:photosystem II stability/assembly factor-like uncharacterized protein
MKKNIAILFIFITFNFCNSQWINQLASGEATSLNCVVFSDSLNGVTGGYNIAQQTGKILYTLNSGNNWNFSQLPDSISSIRDINIINPNLYYSAGSFIVNVLDNNFSSTNPNPFTDNSILLYSLGLTSKGAFLNSTDKGISWKSYGVLPSNVNYFTSLSFLNSQYGFAACDIGNPNTTAGILKTTNGGSTWTLLPIPANIFWLVSIHLVDSLNIISVGTRFTNLPNQIYTGIILKTTNGGSNWTEIAFPDVNGFNSVHFLNTSTGFAVGNGNPTETYKMKGTIYKTMNGGDSWLKLNTSLSDTSFLNSVKFLPDGTGIIQGGKYKIVPPEDILREYIYVLKSSDFGSNWIMSKVATGNYVGNKIDMINSTKYYLCGYNTSSQGLIYYTANGGGTSINNNSNEVPSNFELLQNYPNPFNPNTKISYKLQVSSYITLIVYDINGKLIKEFINGKQNAGEYTYEFDGSGLPSGIYFYRLQAGNIKDTKKMVLLK